MRRLAGFSLVAAIGLLLSLGTAPVVAAAGETANMVPFVGAHSISRTYGHPGGHDTPGIDLRMPVGTPVYAAGPGTVVGLQARCRNGHRWCSGRRGNYVEVAHPDGRHSRYLHFRPGGVRVAMGDEVARGELLGYSGTTGDSTGPHLHYDELVRGARVPPGPMFALQGSAVVTYRSWPAADERILRNEGYPLVDLSVEVTGSGTVTSTPEGIDCGDDCAESLPPGTLVTLTPEAAPLYRFAGWDGACSGYEACELEMNASATVTATFVLEPAP